MKRLWKKQKMCTECMEGVQRLCKRVYKRVQRCMEGVQKVCGWDTEGPDGMQRVDGGCVGMHKGAWRVCGECMKGAWRMHVGGTKGIQGM